MDNDNTKDAKNEQHPPNKGNEHARKPDPETLGTTDPEEHMKGPISSVMQKIRKEAEKNNDKPEPPAEEKNE
jgi:hypothetical protein